MLYRYPTRIPGWLNFAAASIGASYVYCAPQRLAGIEELDAEIIATFDGATALTGITWGLFSSDDGTNWEPIEMELASTGATAKEFTLAAVAGGTVRDRLQTTSFRDAPYTALAVKKTGGAASGADAALSNLNFSSF